MKKLLEFSAMALLFSVSCFAAVDYSSSAIGLEIQNKARRPLWIAVLNGDTVFQAQKIDEIDIKGLKKLSPEISSVGVAIDTAKPTKLALWYQNPGRVAYGKTKLGGLAGKENFIPTPSKVYSFAPHKTIYLTWDSADFPRPQTGKLGGFSGVTNSGLSLKNNVESNDIKQETN